MQAPTVMRNRFAILSSRRAKSKIGAGVAARRPRREDYIFKGNHINSSVYLDKSFK
jgi:hypothetical protein